MTDSSNIRIFEYRPCRITAGFAVDFVVGKETLRGLCRNVSDTGIRAEFEGAVAVENSGLLILRHPTGVLKLQARVAYLQRGQVGLLFLFQTPQEREITIEFIASITNHAANPLFVRMQ